jgi:hypothetical protein
MITNNITGSIGGTLLAITVIIGTEDVIKTIVLAVLGAAVSCLVSVGLNKVIQILSKKGKKPSA